MEQNPNQEPAPSDATELIGPRLEDRLAPEVMRRLVMVDALRLLNEDFLFFVPSEKLSRLLIEASDPSTSDEIRIRLLDQWDEQARQQLEATPKNAGEDIGLQIMSASNWLSIGNDYITRDRLNGAYLYADQEQFFFITKRIDQIVSAYRSDAFENTAEQPPA